MCPMHVNETITPLQAWQAVLATFLLLGRLIRGARILGGAYWGPEDFSEIRARLIPLLQAAFALLIQASSVVFSRVQFDEETPHRMRHWGEEGTILIETTNGQKVQMEYCRIDFEDEPWVPKPCFFPSLV
ncbi:expressed unknown protein [Seminavis robusta]|uniref:Uncharacterized protein n=1 Tax=Seminavis robusta TaxID=568900 RepID=A0A9N8EVV3_9STRA|nr:expressed unknown protein [Seminavis robusta]|eukprot:Sro2040_g312190.1 n/a (130) ;mRNA; r:2572-2961